MAGGTAFVRRPHSPRRPRRWSTARVAERLRLRRPGRPAIGWTLRLTVAAVASYVVAELAFPGAAPLTAALTALLVVQLTPVSLLVSGLDRVVSVVAGVGLAVLVSSAVGLTWWSLGLIIAISLVLGQMLRLGPNLLEVPISAMLVLGAGSVGASAAPSDPSVLPPAAPPSSSPPSAPPPAGASPPRRWEAHRGARPELLRPA